MANFSSIPADPAVNPNSGFKSRPRFHIFGIISLLLFLWLGWSVIDYFYGDNFSSTSLRGNFVTATYLPQGANQGKNFLVTDGSFHFFYQTSSPGRTSSGVTSIFNKIYFGFYQPGKSEILQRQIINFNKETPVIESFLIDGKIWLFGPGSSDRSNFIDQIDSDSGAVLQDLVSLQTRVPEFKQGILEIGNVNNRTEDLNVSVKLLDGSTWYFFPGVGKAFKGYQDYLTWLTDTNKSADLLKPAQAVYLTGDTPAKLARISGPAIFINAVKESNSSSPSIDYSLSDQLQKKTGQKFGDQTLKTDDPFGNKTFIEGKILFQDNDYALIIHQQTAEDLSPRLLSLVDLNQGKITTLTEAQLLPDMRVNPHDDFTSEFFVDSDLSAERAGDYMLFKFSGVGVLGINVKTGQVDWIVDGNHL